MKNHSTINNSYLNTFSTVKLLIVSLLFALLLQACSEKNNKKKATIIDVMKSEVFTKEALSKSWKLLQEGQQLADNGKSIDEIIKTFPDSTIVQTNETAILFFINGSVPMLIELPKKEDKRNITKGGGSFTTPKAAQITNQFLSLATTTISEDEELVDVLASKKGEDEREKKKALIISPFLDIFGNNDDGLTAKKYLEKNKNYKSRVEFLTEINTLNTYSSFADYDLVHLSTHGVRFCNAEYFANGSEIEIISGGDSNYCKTLINTGIKHPFESKEEIEEVLALNPAYKDLLFFSKTTIYLKSTFFDYHYGTGLKDKIWIFSACELGQRSDMQESMKNIHSNGHFFYWLNTVYAENSKPAFEKFYKNLVKEGLDANKAFEKTPVELRSNLPSEFNDSITTMTSLIHLQTDEPRHGIEVIELWHPEKKERIEEDMFYPLVGDFGDGQDEALTLKIQLKGYTRAEFEQQQMTLSLKVDDETVLSKKPFLPDVEDDEIEVEDLEDHEYGVEVTIADIAIPDVEDKDKITLKAYLHLNEQNFSVHKERVIIKADGIKATLRGQGKTIVMTR